MNARHTATWKRMGALVCSIGTAAMLATPAAALATEANQGSTEVTVQTSNSNIKFKAPTVIPFAVNADGTLTGPSPSKTKLENLSVFGIHVTNMTVTQQDPWILVADATAVEQDNAIDFQVGPESDLKDAFDASQAGGIDLSSREKWDMGYMGSENDNIQLSSTGTVSHTTQDLFNDENKVATITWTVEAGQHDAS